ncbi:WD repeat-containing protein 74 [Telopea speciosissima]|uniref:WD repeat-containing protein 74 n=1 Tax=Telopea speciosissima TaxID=54955 RepID=UPI001CC4ED92|nr:WD repeat-containing protein 74 [Telopea speciosissima]
MPRTSAVECPGCPPIRALTFDVLGLVKVIEARGKPGIPNVVARWGEPDSSRCVLAASIDDRKDDPLLAVARKNGLIELLNPLNGDLRVTISKVGDAVHALEDDPISGLHLFRRERLELSSRLCTVLTCTKKGKANLRSVGDADSPTDSTCSGSTKTWDVCAAGDILCSAVDGNENYAFFGGKGVEVNMWDLEKSSKIWTAKPPPKNSLGIFTPTWFTAATFLCKEDHRKIVAGTNSHQVRLYDISSQRRPVISFDFRESPIKALTEDPDGYTVYFGTGSGDLASVDMRTGKLLGCFVGKCCGSIRSIARHPELPVIASCGLDGYLRFWDSKTRQSLSAVFLKQHLTNVVIDSNFVYQEVAGTAVDPPQNEAEEAIQTPVMENEPLPMKRRKTSEESQQRKKKPKKKSKRVKDEDDDTS